MARGPRAVPGRRTTNTVRVPGRTLDTDASGCGSEPDLSRSSASAEISAAPAFRTSAAAATSLACCADDCGCILEDPASVITVRQQLSGACSYSGRDLCQRSG